MRFFINSLIAMAVIWLFYAYVLVPHVFPPREEAPTEEVQVVTFGGPAEISRRNTAPRKVPIRYLVIHGTANDSSYADAMWHHTYLDTTSREVSWHVSIDSMGVVVHFPDSLVCYAASSRKMNHQSINIELCQPGGSISLTTLHNAVKYIREVRRKFPNIRVIFHDEVPEHVDDAKLHGKVCPAALGRGARNLLRTISQEPGKPETPRDSWHKE